MGAYKFQVHKESLKRKFSVYIIVAKYKNSIKLYVGKTGDNREGCNPVISRCGNHFSYNKIHSQMRNKIGESYEKWEYTYIFDHFDDYDENPKKDEDFQKRKKSIDKINEMERWLNEETQKLIINQKNCELLNPYKGKNISKEKKKERAKLRTKIKGKKISCLVDTLSNMLA